ncbi:MAG TPA: envelope stress response membrane protein PspB [Azospirillaceae bacterium]|nr:envelope stress response membrane protein PspB [Azospirillaceae bacterium]
MSAQTIIPVMVFAIPIVAIVMNHMTKWRMLKAQGLSEGAAAALMDRADRLDERVRQLETILDAEAPGWRARA